MPTGKHQCSIAGLRHDRHLPVNSYTGIQWLNPLHLFSTFLHVPWKNRANASYARKRCCPEA